MFRNLILFLAIALIAAVTFSACGEDDPVSSDPGKANVMAIHASPDAPGVDVYVDNKLAQENLTFPNNTPYIEVDAGTRNVRVNVYNSQITVFNENLPFDANKNYSAFAIDRAINLDALLLIDDLTAPASGKSHIRFINLSPDAPAVNITYSDGIIIFADVDFAEVIDFTSIDSGTYNLQVRDAAINNLILLELNGISLQEGKIYTVFTQGFYEENRTPAFDVSIINNN